MTVTEVHQRVIAQQLLAIIRTDSEHSARSATEAVISAGLHSLEVTLTSPGALRVIRDLRRDYPHATIGAGTVLDLHDAQRCADAGAEFIVSPHTDATLIEWAAAHGLAAYPGAATATEVVAAHRAGAPAVKLFPAGTYGIAHMKALRAPLPGIQFIPTGGVTTDAAGDWLRAGAVAVGLGGDLTRGDLSEVAGRVEQVLKHVGELVA